MSKLNRRSFITFAGAATTLGVLGSGSGAWAWASKKGAKVVVVGGGFGGATAAKYIRKMDPSIEVTLVEPKQTYTTCPSSNWVLGGLRSMGSITFRYTTLASRYGIRVVHQRVTTIDPEKKQLRLASGDTLPFDRLILSPGIDFRWETIEGYSAEVSQKVPHAWQAGPQTTTLLQQLQAMPNGGTVAICSPPNPFRCPPGPYERASMIAHYLKTRKPKSKILILDAKEKFSKQELFIQGWEALYGYGTDKSLIEWVSASQDGKVVQVDADKKKVFTEFGDHKADVLNVIPAQKAGQIAHQAGVTDSSGWCPVDHATFESTQIAGIHVIGDASIASPLPKSGYAANSEAKVCAAAVVELLQGRTPATPTWVNTCYSLVGPRYGISVAMVYRFEKGKVAKVKGSGGVTPNDGDRGAEARYADSWYKNITKDLFL